MTPSMYTSYGTTRRSQPSVEPGGEDTETYSPNEPLHDPPDANPSRVRQVRQRHVVRSDTETREERVGRRGERQRSGRQRDTPALPGGAAEARDCLGGSGGRDRRESPTEVETVVDDPVYNGDLLEDADAFLLRDERVVRTPSGDVEVPAGDAGELPVATDGQLREHKEHQRRITESGQSGGERQGRTPTGGDEGFERG